MRSALVKWIRYFLGISRTEANGVIVMAIIMLLIAFIPLFVSRISRPDDLDIDQKQHLDSLAAILDHSLSRPKVNPSVTSTNENSVSYFSFDPNTANYDDFLLLGLSGEISNRILKYIESGGSFNKREDFKKIYGLTDDKFQELLPYIKIDEGIPLESFSEPIQPGQGIVMPESEEVVQFNINKVDSSELIVVNGIGPTLSGRIVRFRESLGGFINMEQLLEVYGLEGYAYDNLLYQAFVGENFVPITIPINDWPADSLARHPYIDFRKARVIVAYREQHGRFKTPSDLMEVLVLEKSWVEKLTPYLDF